MDRNDIDRHRARLLRRREELLALESTRSESGATVELDQTRQGRLSRMDALQGQAMARATAARARNELARIDAALRRCDRADYGFCMECGEAIDERRLTLDPTAIRCIACAERRENG